MRRGIVVAAAALCCLVLTSVAGADLIDVKVLLAYKPARFPVGQERIYIHLWGTATAQENVLDPGTSFVQSHDSTFINFSGYCAYLADTVRVRSGYVALCDVAKTGPPELSGSVTYTRTNPVTHTTESCVGTVSFRPGSQWLIGGTLASANVMNAESAPPLVVTASPSASQLVIKSSNPALGCTGLTLQTLENASTTKQPDYGQYRVNRLMPFPGLTENKWEGPISVNLIRGTATFDGYLKVDVERDSTDEAKSGADGLLAGLQQWWNDRMNQLNSQMTPGAIKLDLPSGGVIQVQWSPGGGVVKHGPLVRAGGQSVSGGSAALFTIDRSIHAGLNTLTPKLTSLGESVLAGTATAPTIDATATFTPTQGSPVTVSERFSTTVFPTVTSVQFTGSPTDPTVIVRGRGLAPLPAQDPKGSPAGHNGCPAETGQTGADYGVQLQINDFAKNWGAGFSIPTATSCIGLIPTKVTSNELDLRLGSFYAQYYPKFTLAPGDEVQVVANGAPIDVHVAYGAPVTK